MNTYLINTSMTDNNDLEKCKRWRGQYESTTAAMHAAQSVLEAFLLDAEMDGFKTLSVSIYKVRD